MFNVFEEVIHIPTGNLVEITDLKPGLIRERYFIMFKDGRSQWTDATFLTRPKKNVNGPQGKMTVGEALVKGKRAGDYGDPDVSFERIAKLWSAHLGTAVTKRDVALMMILLKVSREKSNHKTDNLDDIEGYVYCARTLKDD